MEKGKKRYKGEDPGGGQAEEVEHGG